MFAIDSMRPKNLKGRDREEERGRCIYVACKKCITSRTVQSNRNRHNEKRKCKSKKEKTNSKTSETIGMNQGPASFLSERGDVDGCLGGDLEFL